MRPVLVALVASAFGCSLGMSLDELSQGTGEAPPSEAATLPEPVCEADVECPEPEFPCERADCVGGVCGTAPMPEGTLLASPKADCTRRVCDAQGKPHDEPDEEDGFDDGNDCTIEKCVGMTVELEMR